MMSLSLVNKNKKILFNHKTCFKRTLLYIVCRRVAYLDLNGLNIGHLLSSQPIFYFPFTHHHSCEFVLAGVNRSYVVLTV